MSFEESRAAFDSYADSFRSEDGSLPEAMQCKYDHTADVIRYAAMIAESSSFSPEDAELAALCALFHDIARFEQVKRFGTYNDRLSGFDHGYEAVRILLERGFVKNMDPAKRVVLLAAVEFHNKKEIPSGICGEYTLKFVRLVRDADKLAILELVLRYLKGELVIHDDSLIALSKNESDKVNPEIISRIRSGENCSYGLIRGMNDFLTCLFAWVGDLNYPCSARELLKRGTYSEIRTFLPKDSVFDEILNLATEKLKCVCSK